MHERLKFIGEYLSQEQSMSALCRHFGISRKTGYKLVSRYLDEGTIGLHDRSRAPRHHPWAVTDELVQLILEVRRVRPRWGPRKLRAWLEQHQPRINWPSASTIGRILKRHGQIVPRGRRRRCPPDSRPLSHCVRPNSVWCADFKGWFRTGDGHRCEPLTITDGYSRYVLACQAIRQTSHATVQPIFEAVFREYGLPWAIRTDNGRPFASTALAGLSRLSVWWIKLGIRPERIDPGHPEQNGRHERFHRTLKAEAITPPAATALDQQVTFDRFCQEFNLDRPHEALNNRTPGSVYTPSLRPFPARLAKIVYPDHYQVRKVRPAGNIWWYGKDLFISETLAGEPVGLEQVDDRLYQVYYSTVKLAVYDEAKQRLIKPPLKKRKRR